MNALQLPSWGLEVAGSRRTGRDDNGIELWSKLLCHSSRIHGLTIAELDALLLHEGDASVDDGLVQLEVGDAIAQQTSCGLVLLEDGDQVTHQVQVVGGGQSCRTGTNDSHLLSVALDVSLRLNKSLTEGTLYDSSLILAVRSWFVVESVQHTSLLA